MLVQEIRWYELIHRKTSLHMRLHWGRYVLSLATHSKIAHALSDTCYTWLQRGCSMCRVGRVRRLVSTNSSRWLTIASSPTHARRGRIRSVGRSCISCLRMCLHARRSSICSTTWLLSAQRRVCTSPKFIRLPSVVAFPSTSSSGRWWAPLLVRVILLVLVLLVA